MEYKLSDDYIILQALLEGLGITQSDGTIKGYLAETAVLSNGQDERRHGKKIRIGDTITIPEENVEIQIIEPTSTEKQGYLEVITEKEHVAAIVKELNQKSKKVKKQDQGKTEQTGERKPVRFLGT